MLSSLKSVEVPLRYGYLCTRLRGKKQRLINKDGYAQMLRANTIYGVLDVLQRTDYASVLDKELEQFGSEQVIREIDRVIWSSVRQDIGYIFSRLPAKDALVLRHFFKNYDAKNVRIVLSAHQKFLAWHDIEPQLLSLGLLDYEALQRIYEKGIDGFTGTFYERYLPSLLKKEKFLGVGKSNKKQSYPLLQDYKEIQGFCDAFERLIYDELYVYVPNDTYGVSSVQRQLRIYIDGLNLLWMLEAKAKNISDPPKLYRSGSVSCETLQRVYKNPQATWAQVFPSVYKKVLSQSTDAVYVERSMRRIFAENMLSLFYQYPFGLPSVTGYIYLKLVEYQNVLAIVKAKSLGVSIDLSDVVVIPGR